MGRMWLKVLMAIGVLLVVVIIASVWMVWKRPLKVDALFSRMALDKELEEFEKKERKEMKKRFEYERKEVMRRKALAGRQKYILSRVHARYDQKTLPRGAQRSRGWRITCRCAGCAARRARTGPRPRSRTRGR